MNIWMQKCLGAFEKYFFLQMGLIFGNFWRIFLYTQCIDSTNLTQLHFKSCLGGSRGVSDQFEVINSQPGFWAQKAWSKVTMFNDSGSTFEMSGSGQIEFFSSNGSKILTSQGPGVMALLFGFWAQFGTFFDKSGSEKHPCRCPWRRGNVAPVERNAQGSTPDHPWSL